VDRKEIKCDDIDWIHLARVRDCGEFLWAR
jgi:hypothetical protein